MSSVVHDIVRGFQLLINNHALHWGVWLLFQVLVEVFVDMEDRTGFE